MSERKNIDRLFQEKFKDFEENPPEFIWDNIREELEEKKKRRVIPIWLRLSGVAAILVMGLLTGIYFINSSTTNNNPVVIDENTTQTPAEPLKILPTDKRPKSDINADNVYDRSEKSDISRRIVDADGESKNDGPAAVENSNPLKNSTPDGNAVPSRNSYNKGTVAYGSKKNEANDTRLTGTVNNAQNSPLPNNNVTTAGNASKNEVSNSGNMHNSAVAHNPTGPAKNNGAPYGDKKSNFSNRAVATNSAPVSDNKSAGIVESTNVALQNFANKNNNAVANNKAAVTTNGGPIGAIKTGNDNPSVATVSNTKGTSLNNSAVTNANSNTTPPANVDKGISLTETAIAAIDTVKPENELEKLLKEKEAGKKEEKDKALADNVKTNKWNVKPQLAPVFYNSLSQGSPIDGQFAGNSKSYENDLSYGVGVNYAITKKITIRSGVNTLNLNYETQGVEFYASLNKSTTNVAARTNANIVVQNQGTGNVTPNAFFENQLPAGTFNGSMMQKTGYVEVPVEMAYALLDKKFGIDIIGGVSTLFLNGNNVSVVSTQGYTTNVGQAQNLNSIHFSTNVGVGFKYRFFKSFEANFEPMFKYQVNTFSRDSGNFKPYFIGLYSGISFSF